MSFHSKIATVVLALGALGAAAAANASTNVYVSVGILAAGHGPVYVSQPQVHVHPRPVHAPYPATVHVPVQPGYDTPPPAYLHEGRHGHERGWRSACRAPKWNPNVRYMPGHTVWRKGNLYMATRLSAAVWNENSPPEWTPKYWVLATCA